MKPTNDGEHFNKGEFLLKNWCFRCFGYENNNLDGFWMVDGRVFNNPKFRDGMFIHTSDVMSIKVLDDRLKVETSNSIYTCMFKDSKEEFYDFTKASDLFDMSANIFDISMLKQKIEEAKEIEKEKQNEYIRKLVKTDALIIFFSDQDEYYFSEFVIKDGKDIIRIDKRIHLGYSSDSILITGMHLEKEFQFNKHKFNYKNIDFRYYEPSDNRIVFYSWKGYRRDIYIVNLGEKELYVRINLGEEIIKPNGKPHLIEIGEDEKEEDDDIFKW